MSGRQAPIVNDRSPRVAIVVDHPERDLAGLVLTALALARRGVICHLVPLNLQAREIWALAPDFVLFNYLRRSNEPFARALAAAGIAFGALDTEGAVWTSADEYASLLWRDAGQRARARCVCMWGPRLAETMIARSLLTRDQVVVTGCPRFDLYADPWRRLREDAAAALERRERCFLVNTNFSISNPQFTTADKSVGLHRTVLGYADSELRRVVRAETVAIRDVVTLAVRLADRYPSIVTVIRPHPFEDPAPYRAAIAGRRNIVVNQSASIQAAIFGAYAVIQRSCTTAIDAGLAGVPALSPQWIPAPFLMPDAEAASVPCETFGELAMHLHAIVRGTFHLPAATREATARVMRECCFAADGCAHLRVAAAVEAALPPRTVIDRAQCRRHLYGFDCSSDGRFARAARYARELLSLSPDWSFRHMCEVPALDWMASAKHFDIERVAQLVERAQDLETRRELAAIPRVRTIDHASMNGHGREIGIGDRSFARYGVTIAPRHGSLDARAPDPIAMETYAS